MKTKILVFLIAISSIAFGQEKTEKASSDLLKTNGFAFIARDVEKRDIYNPDKNIYYQMAGKNPSVMSPSERKYITTDLPAKNYLVEQNLASGIDRSYFDFYGIPKSNKVLNDTLVETLYLVNDKEGLSLNTITSNNLKSYGFRDFKAVDYKVKIKKKNNSTLYTYTIKENDNTKKIYLEVYPDNTATLQQSSANNKTIYLKGYVQNII